MIDPWFVLPGSVRTRDISLQKTGMLGRYTATLEINPGYGSTTQTKRIAFYVVSPFAVLVTIVLCAGVMFGVRRVVLEKINKSIV